MAPWARAGKELLDWNAEIKPGPREVGFDYSFIMAATGDRVPCVYIENQKIVGLDPVRSDPGQLRQAVRRRTNRHQRTGSSQADWSHGHNMAVVNGIGRIGFDERRQSRALERRGHGRHISHARAFEFIERNKDKPFFLYFATHDIHVPRVPHARFVGKTTMGPRGDVIVSSSLRG